MLNILGEKPGPPRPGKITSISLPSLTKTVVLAIGGSEPTVANHPLKNDACGARAP